MPKAPAKKKAAKKPAPRSAKKAPARKPARAAQKGGFKLTYATMFNPPDSLHVQYDQALADLKAGFGRDVPMLINGQDVYADFKFENHSPINTDWMLATFQKGTADDVNAALSAATLAWPAWAALRWQDRIKLVRKGAEQIEKRIYEIGGVLSLEVGKNRMEALGDAQEVADLIYYACDQVEANKGFVKEMGRDPLKGYKVTNFSVLRPYGVWVVISPFNFPAALCGGPVGAALAAGNTVVAKPASDTPWTSRLLAECFRDAGLPDGVFNYVTGGGATVGEALINDPRVAGITFTGSYDVGMKIYRQFAQGEWPRPCIAEMGGKNPAIVSRHANLEDAARGIVRSAFGLQGQKCSACSRVFVERDVKDKLTELILAETQAIKVGDPTLRENWMGPVINATAHQQFGEFSEELSGAGSILHGGHKLTHQTEALDYSKGYYAEPTVVDGVPRTHRLWQHEMFLPITLIETVDSLDEAMALANDVKYGLTAGFYGSPQEVDWFFDKIEAGVTYANRPQGATTGAWPGYQPFGGWKGSGSSGKNGGGLYYVQLYMHEQIRTLVRR